MESKAERRIVLVTTTLAAFLVPFMGSSVNIALPAIGARYSADAVALGWTATVYILAAAMLLVPLGKAADTYGRKMVFTLGLAVYALFSLACAFAPNLQLFLLARTIQGAGAAGQFGTSVAILAAAYPPERRGRVLGINVAATYSGLTLGPFLGGFLTASLGWQSVFLVTAAGSAAVAVLAQLRIREDKPESAPGRFDLRGALLYAAALAALNLGSTLLPDPAALPAFAAGAAAFGLFILNELRSADPVLNLELFRRNRVFVFSSLAAFINYAATFAVAFLLSLYLQYVKGMDAREAGTVLLVQPLMQALFSPLTGRLSDRVSPRVLASLGMAFCSAGLVLLAGFDEATELGLVTAGLAFLGLGFALFSSPNTNAIMGSVDRRFYGLASALTGTMRLLGQMLSLGFVMAVFNLVMGRVKVSPELHGRLIESMHIVFAVSAALCGLGILASLARGGKAGARAPSA